ncbi:PQQ-dependent sugar dehydrogenase [Nakamurella leprariae]|uniref:PQQ-dependent sugar dehydrogenase n=1 Tax=Nakamurella leprariae TaxID=2803911 RepID=A0A938Y8U1_9ACTN|nr:PQQ-dependent sugar dehydrogenase [Nakamurella leprariae]MBM9468151.1 PQQ-dependent sugar dehydrogenase [Nakamurella leprariae]
MRPPARRPRRTGRARPRARLAGLAAAAALLLTGCADFSGEPAPFTVQPSLTAVAPQPVEPSTGRSTSPTPPTGSAPPSGTTDPDDPCAPTDPAVIATCLAAPWGLAPLPDGQSAFVGERTTGRILQVARNTPTREVAVIEDLDASGTGGLLGIALSPAYAEDRLLYAYVTTATDNRVVKIAEGDVPKPVITGIPKGAVHNGGRIAFAGDGSLIIGTGDAGNPALAADPASLAGTVLRVDEFGAPRADNPTPGSPVLARGFTDVTGACRLADGSVAVIDHRDAADLLIMPLPGRDYTAPVSGDALWSWARADGGANDCAVDAGTLASTSLDTPSVSGLAMSPDNQFSGDPAQLLDGRYGRLLTVVPDGQGLLWLTTSNKDGVGTPVPSDDRVLVLPTSENGGGGGPD